MKKTKPRCEGYHLHPAFGVGGGTGKWEQCTSTATQLVSFIRKKGVRVKSTTLPACDNCYKKLVDGLDADGAKITQSKMLPGV